MPPIRAPIAPGYFYDGLHNLLAGALSGGKWVILARQS